MQCDLQTWMQAVNSIECSFLGDLCCKVWCEVHCKLLCKFPNFWIDINTHLINLWTFMQTLMYMVFLLTFIWISSKYQGEVPCKCKYEIPCKYQGEVPCKCKHEVPCKCKYYEGPCKYQGEVPCKYKYEVLCKCKYEVPCKYQGEVPCKCKYEVPCKCQCEVNVPCKLLREYCDISWCEVLTFMQT